jgi:hypothetical protein
MAHRSTEFPHPWCRSTHCHLERPGWCRYARNVMFAERCFSSTSSFANFVRRERNDKEDPKHRSVLRKAALSPAQVSNVR